MRSSRKNRPSPNLDVALRFGPGEPAGFTSVGVAGFQNLNPAAVVRELIQNSLDAAREARRDIARVRFEVLEHSLNDIPGIREYRASFRRAVQAQMELQSGKLSAQADLVVQSIRRRLSARRCKTLFILDNGIGLDTSRMNGLLGDGLSIKDDSGAGAFGNGHYVVVPASDLRYILYGGRTHDGSAICAGHAILASHQSNREVCGKDGYFVRGFQPGKLFDRYIFARDQAVPAYLAERLQWIASRWSPGAGTVVAVPCFNEFNIRDEDATLWDLIAKPAACNFFAAFANSELCVEVAERDSVEKLDAGSIAEVLESVAEQKRSRNFLSGSRAMSAFETIRWDSHKKVVRTPIGDIPIWLREIRDGGISRIDLCRAGMWISDDIPKLRRQKFSDLKPFHCVLQLDAACGEVHDLVRKAEGPLHNHLEARKWLSAEERTSLDRALNQVADEIRETVGTLSSDRVFVDDVLQISDYGVGVGGRQASSRGQFAEMRAYHPERRHEEEIRLGGRRGGTDDPVNPNPLPGNRPRPMGRPIRFRAVAVPVDLRSCRVEIKPDEGFDSAEVRFGLDESLDASCDDSRGEAFAQLENVRVCSQGVDSSKLTKNEAGKPIGILLGKCSANVSWPIEFDFQLPDDMQLPADCRVVLKTMLFRQSPNRLPPGAGIVEQRVPE